MIGISFCLIVFKLGSAAKERVSLPPLNTTDFVVPTTTTAASTSSSTTSRREAAPGLRNHLPP